MRLNQVTLPALDVALSVAFYRRLGFVQIVDAPHYARFDTGSDSDVGGASGASFSLHRHEGDLPLQAAVIYFEDDDLDATVQRLHAAGIQFTQMPRDEPWLWREARLQDPAGNTLCLYRAGVNRLHPPWRMPAPAA